MILASAQTFPTRNNIKVNLEDHFRMTELAAKNGASLVVFPEMSLSGYERAKASDLAFTLEDSRLNALRKLSADKKITIVAGAPVRIGQGLFIGSLIIQPDGSILIYTKQFLHGEENNYFTSSFQYNPVIEVENERVSFAICADINNPKHPENAKNAGTSVYTAGIFFEPHEMVKAHTTLSNYAKTHSMNVLMSNFVGQPFGLSGGGKSAFWNKNGELVSSLNGTHAGILFIEKIGENWKEKEIQYE